MFIYLKLILFQYPILIFNIDMHLKFY